MTEPYIEEKIEELYNKNPYRYRPLGNSSNDGLENVRQALTQAKAAGIAEGIALGRGCVPEEKAKHEKYPEKREYPSRENHGWNDCRLEALRRLDSLTEKT